MILAVFSNLSDSMILSFH